MRRGRRTTSSDALTPTTSGLILEGIRLRLGPPGILLRRRGERVTQRPERVDRQLERVSRLQEPPDLEAGPVAYRARPDHLAGLQPIGDRHVRKQLRRAPELSLRIT